MTTNHDTTATINQETVKIPRKRYGHMFIDISSSMLIQLTPLQRP
jgi:hypothetical protein